MTSAPLLQDNIDKLLQDMAEHGWAVQPHFFSETLIQQLRQRLQDCCQQGQLKQAGIGRQQNFHIEQSIRSDRISWFDEHDLSDAQQSYLQQIDRIRQALNRQFYLGLFEFEVHFALYEENAFYKRHLDQHKNHDTRVVTLITYLNENWQEQDGGALQLYLPDGKVQQVLPQAGTVVCFFSAEFEHEVLPARRQRASLTGWFRRREANRPV